MLNFHIFCVILILIAAVTSDDTNPDEVPTDEVASPASDEDGGSAGKGGQSREGGGVTDENNMITGPRGSKPVSKFVRLPCKHLEVDTNPLVQIVCYVGDMDQEFSCGGTLIDSMTVLTAGHCVRRASRVIVHIMPDTYYHVELEMDKVLMFSDDLAMIKMKKGLPSDLHIDYAKIPGTVLPENLEEYCKDILFAGWGHAWPEDGSGWCEETLMCVYLSVQSKKNDKKCIEIVKPPEEVVHPTGVDTNWFCSISNSSGCYGDSGGGAFCVETNELLGIMSYVTEDCMGGAFFTRIDGQLNQIHRGLRSGYVPEEKKSKGSRVEFEILLFLFAIAMEIIVAFM